MDPEGRTVYANAKMAAILGCTLEELRGAGLGDFIFPEDAEELARHREERIGGKPDVFDVRFRRPDGSTVWTTVSTSPVRNGSGRVVGGLGMFTDITARRRAEEELARAHQRLRDLFLGIRGIIFAADPESWRTNYVSQQAEEILGHPLDRWYEDGFWIDHVVHPEDRDEVVRITAEALEAGVDGELEYRALHADGSVLWLREITRLGRDDAGRVEEIRGIMVDITEQRRLGMEVERSERMRVVGQVAGGVAHDLRNVLMGVGGVLELVLMEEELTPSARADLSEALQVLNRGRSVTSRLLAFSRQKRDETRRLELNRFILERADFLRRIFREDVTIEVRPSDGEAWVEAGDGAVEQALLNIAKNAEDAMPDGGRLAVSIHVGADALEPFGAGQLELGAWVRVSLTDTGVGMPPEILERACDPFFTTKEPGEGTGLGLASVYGTVAGLGGRLVLESEVGRGTTVHLAFPGVEAPVEAASLPPEVEEEAARDGGSLVLLVEDDAAVRDVCRRVLEKAGYRVVTASDAPEARRSLEELGDQLRILVTDAVLPGGSGVRIAEAFLDHHPEVPVLVISGYTDVAVLDPRLDFLAKPFSIAELVDRVAGLLRESEAEARQAG